MIPRLELIRSFRGGRIFTSVAAFVLIVLAATAACASSLSDYRSRVEAAQQNIDGLRSAVARSGAASISDNVQQTIALTKRLLPDNERVEFNGTSIDVSNAWVKARLDELANEPLVDDRLTILRSISERLGAISDHINELEKAQASGRSKDQDKQKLAEILRREEYQKPEQKQESLFQRWLREFLEWLEGLFPRPNISPSAVPDLQPLSVILQIMIYGVIIGLIGFLIYKSAPLIARRFGGRVKTKAESRVVLGEHIDANVSARDLFDEAQELARRGDLRGAIRKGYIALLCDLADRKVIGLARYKTNRDYLRDVRKKPTLFEGMKRATGSFEQHWYGFRQPAMNDWEEFLEQCRKASSEA